MKNVLPKFLFSLLLLFLFFLVNYTVIAQRLIANQINQLKVKTTTPRNYRPFLSLRTSARIAADTVFKDGASVYRFMMNLPEIGKLQQDNTGLVEISLPISESKSIDLELMPYSIFGKDFKVRNSRNEIIEPQNLGKFYHGIVKGDNFSIASISIIDGKISGVISQKSGNMNLGLEEESGNYILFNEQDLKQKPAFECGMDKLPVRVMGQNLLKEPTVSTSVLANVACGSVEVYMEADSALFAGQGGSIANTVNYVNSIFSKVATLYAGCPMRKNIRSWGKW